MIPHTHTTSVRRSLRQMSVPAALAFVIVTVLTLLALLVAAISGLVAEVAERLAAAGETARAATRGPVVIDAGRDRYRGRYGAPRAAAGCAS